MKDNQILNTPYYNYYIIEKGDTLYNIGKKYNLNPVLIAQLNGIKENEYIYPGQTIMLPIKGVQYYITKDNDTVKSVSNILGKKEEDIISQNRTIYLLPGQMIFFKEK